MAAALQEALGIEAELVEGDHGVFDVAVDGEVVYSKQKIGRFIGTPKILQLVRTRVEEHPD